MNYNDRMALKIIKIVFWALCVLAFCLGVFIYAWIKYLLIN